MNDFTKEELEKLEEILSWHGSSPPYSLEKIAIKLQRKIQSMIDNYCEHIYVFRCHDDTIYCPKCGGLLNKS